MGFDPQWFLYYPMEYRVSFPFEALYLYLMTKVLQTGEEHGDGDGENDEDKY